MTKLTAQIGLKAAVFLVISVVIGSGVFKKIAPMSAELGSPLLIILCWVLAGIISLAGALGTAEMAGMFPNSGGEYFYFQKVFGRFFSFLYGWANFTVLKTASISALAYIFAESLNSLILLPDWSSPETVLGFAIFKNASVKILASLLIIVLSLLNYRGVVFAERLSRGLTFVMIMVIILFLIAGFSSHQGSFSNLASGSLSFDHSRLHGWTLIKALMVASLGAFWGYEGWNSIGFIGEEVKNPKRNLPIALGVGTLIIIVLYVLLNIVYVYVLPIDFFIQLSATPNKIAAVEVAEKISGRLGGIVIACLILVTTLNANNSTILMSARMLYAMARDKVFFKKAASIHPVYHTPDVALLLQAIWAIVLVWSGSFDQLTDMLVFASFIFYGSTSLCVIIMRIKQPGLPRTYKVFGYPFVPAFFCIFCISLFIVTIINQPKEAIWGLSLIATGVPVYWWKRKKQERE